MRLAHKARAKLSKLLGRPSTTSLLVDQEAIDRFLAVPSNLALVSFPRTGSHWLRMLMELYFERPVLRRAFYYPERTDYVAYHAHDVDLDFQRENVIYLYRGPVDTVHSLLNYHQEPADSHERIAYWADLYGQHLDKWLYQERFTKKKTMLTYEGMKRDLPAEFTKVTRHLGMDLAIARVTEAAERVSRDEVNRKTVHDPHVVDLQAAYSRGRGPFRASQAQEVWEAVLHGRPHLEDAFDVRK